MNDLYSKGLTEARVKREEIRLRTACLDAVIACLRMAKGGSGGDALRKSAHAAIESFRAYLAWQGRYEATRKPVRYTIRRTRRFAKTLYGMMTGDRRSWAFALHEANRVPGRKAFRDVKRLSPFREHAVIIVSGCEVDGDFTEFFTRLNNGVRLWKMPLGKPPDAPLFIALEP